jgi:DNA-binding GntR family transcriptional regulator
MTGGPQAIHTADTADTVNSPVLPREITMAEPEWRRVAAEIRQRIRDGRTVDNGDGTRRLPRYDELLAEHHTTYGTLRSALLVLESERWIIRRPGKDLQVHPNAPA